MDFEARRQAAWAAVTDEGRRKRLTVDDFRAGAELFNEPRTFFSARKRRRGADEDEEDECANCGAARSVHDGRGRCGGKER